MMPVYISCYVVYSVDLVKIINGGKDISSDSLSWIEIEFIVCRGVGQLFLNFTIVKEGIHEAYSTSFIEYFNS